MSIVIRTPRPHRSRTYRYVTSQVAANPTTNAPTNRARNGSPSIAQKMKQPTTDEMRN